MIDVRSDEPLFALGQLVITRNASDRLSDVDVVSAIRRHAVGDWANLMKKTGSRMTIR